MANTLVTRQFIGHELIALAVAAGVQMTPELEQSAMTRGIDIGKVLWLLDEHDPKAKLSKTV